MGVGSIVFSGGEPLTWPWLYDAVSACATHDLHCSIYSSGINPGGDGAKDLLTLAKHGLHKVVFSLYSSRKEFHEQITTQAGSFQDTVSAISATKDSGLERGMHFVPIKRNYSHLDELVKLAEDNRVPRVSILRFAPKGRGVLLKGSQEMLFERETVELRKLIMKCRQSYDVTIRVGSPYNILLLDKDVECNAARRTLIIGPNGNIYPCDAFKNIEPRDIGVEDSFNNILSHSLEECWQQSTYLNTIRDYLSKPLKEPCLGCVKLEWCKSGCLAQKLIDHGSTLNGDIAGTPDPLCLRRGIGGSNA